MRETCSRRQLLHHAIACAGSLAAAIAGPSHAQDSHDGGERSRPLPDMLDYMVRTLGPPRQAESVRAEDAIAYKDRVPPRLIRFWQEHGRGSYLDGMYWICDPAPFRAVLDLVFKDDPEFDGAEMTAVSYDAFGDLKMWHRVRANMIVHFATSQVFCSPESSHIDQFGKRFSDDYMISTTVAIVPSQYEPSTLAFLGEARRRLGSLAPGEVYGFFPALQLGGAYAVENLRRVRAVEHFMLLAQLAPMNLVELTPPEQPRFPYGRQNIVRPIGPKRG